MSGYRGGTEDNRLLFIENYWKLIELKNAFYASGTSVYLHAQLIMMNAEILINTIPRDHKLDYNYFRDMVQDLIKVAAMLLRALDQHLDENRKEWHKMTNEDIEELKNVA
jgi:ribonucleotide reductase beta subunit family protein with ferritin-like domain